MHNGPKLDGFIDWLT